MDLPEHMIHQSFRYVLGRMSYAVSEWVDWCVRAWPDIPESERAIIRRELDEAFMRAEYCDQIGAHFSPLGSECDREQWERVRALYQEGEKCHA